MPSSLIRLLFAFSVVWSVPSWCGARWIFESNVGQTATPVRFLGRAGSSAAYVTPSEVVLTPWGGQDVLRLRFHGAGSRPAVEGADPLPGHTNYLTGAGNHTGIPQFGRVRYRELYPGIDLVLYGGDEGLEYDFEVSPGADPRAISLRVQGAKQLALDGRGDLLIAMEGGEVRQRRPRVHQESGGIRTEISCDYVLKDFGEVRLKLGAYDPKENLVIDPVLAFSSQLGRAGDIGNGLASDSEGNVYVVGSALSTDFPTTPGAYSRTRKGEYCSFDVSLVYLCTDVFVAKFNRQGDLLYSTYVGGTQVDYGRGIAVDAAGNAYVTGSTKSSDFPVTTGAFQTTFRGGNCRYDPMPGPPISYPCDDAFVLKLNPSGSGLVYATYLGGGGSDYGRAVTVDGAGNATAVGITYPADFPASPSPPPSADPDGAFITKLDASGRALVFSRFFRASDASAVAADPVGDLYVTGTATSADFPYTPGAFLGPSSGSGASVYDAFAVKLSAGGDVLYAARIGSVRSFALPTIAVDSQGRAHITGVTQSDSFPVTESPPGTRTFPGPDLFLTKLDPQGATLVYSLRIGGRGNDYGIGVALDGADNAYVIGQTDSREFPVTVGAIQPCAVYTATRTIGTQAVLLKINASGTSLLYSTRLDNYRPSAIAVDGNGNPWLTGDNAFVAKVDFSRDIGRKVTCVASAASLAQRSRFSRRACGGFWSRPGPRDARLADLGLRRQGEHGVVRCQGAVRRHTVATDLRAGEPDQCGGSFRGARQGIYRG